MRGRIYANHSEVLKVWDVDSYSKSREVLIEIDNFINTLDVYGDILLVPLPQDEDYADFLTYSP